MLLRLLGPAFDKSADGRDYRGVDRESIPYVDAQEDPAAGEIFDQYIELRDEHGDLHDIEFCRRAVEVYRHLNPPRELEVVEVTVGKEHPTIGSSEFLGFDVTCARHISLLPQNVRLDVSAMRVAADDPVVKLAPLIELIRRYFVPLLNQNGLFDEYNTAALYLDTMMAVQKFRPNLWEGDDCNFEVLGIWHVA
jgi:hypothetical protein